MLKIFKKMMVFVVLLCIILSLSACGSSRAQQKIDELNQQISSQDQQLAALRERIALLEEMLGVPEQDFADDIILVEINDEFLDRTFTVDDFAIIEAVKVELLTPGMYAVEIANKGKINILVAIKLIEDVEFIKSATPNYAWEPAM